MVRVAVGQQVHVAARGLAGVRLVARQLVHRPGVVQQARRARERERTVEGDGRGDVGNRGGRRGGDGELRELVHGQIGQVRGHLGIRSPPRRGPRHELGGDVTQVVRSWPHLVHERGDVRVEASHRPDAALARARVRGSIRAMTPESPLRTRDR